MKKINLTLLLSFCAIALYAQDSYMEIVRSTINNEKKVLIAEVMQLTNEESSVFWPVYNEFEEQMYKINTDYYNLINEFADNFEHMSAETATDIINKAGKLDIAREKLKSKYNKKMMKVISPQKTLRFAQASNKIEVMIDAQLASQIPLLESIE